MHPGPQGERGKPSLCALDKREQVQYLAREGPAPAGTRAAGSCGQERAAEASPTRTRELPPAGCSHLCPGQRSPHRTRGTSGIHPWCGAWIRGRGAPACPCLCFPARGSRARARPQLALSRGVSTREGPGASPEGIGAEPAPAATSLQGACKHAATAPIPRASPEGGGAGHNQAGGQPPGWVCGAGCVPVGLCPWVGAGWGGWRVLTRTDRKSVV